VGAKFPPICTPYLDKQQDSKHKTDFGVQYILHKRMFLEVFVNMTQILYFHPSHTCRTHGMSPKDVAKKRRNMNPEIVSSKNCWKLLVDIHILNV
jgi:hypothetical protein